MKMHHNYVFFSDVDFFVYNVIQTSCFFFLKQVAEIYEQISQCVSLAVDAYWNPCGRLADYLLW